MRRTTLTLIIAIVVGVVAVSLWLRTNETPPQTDAGASTTSSTVPSATTDAPATGSPTTTTAISTTTQATQTTLPPGTSVCDFYSGIETTGQVEAGALVEASGLAVSRTTPGVLWAHNDSRGAPNLFAFTEDGEDLGAFDVPNAGAFDWEDMAAGPGAQGDGSFLYVGDIGDNFGIRGGNITVYVVPDSDPATMNGSFSGSTRNDYSYANGSFNAEALFIDPVEPALYVISKNADSALVLKGPLSDTSITAELELVAVLSLGEEVSAADMSADGSTLVLRGYDHVWMWFRDTGVTIEEMLQEAPCSAPSPVEIQGESVALDETHSYWTVSEGLNSAIQKVERQASSG